jgi:hypothetical protein
MARHLFGRSLVARHGRVCPDAEEVRAMSLMPTTRRAEEFARLLENGRRTDDPVVAPLTALATALQAVPQIPAPRDEFRAALRQRLVAVATVAPAAEPEASPVTRLREAGATWRARRRVAVVAGGAAAVTAIAGIGVSASRSIPGDPFYGIKRAAERVQLAAAETKEAKGKRHLEFARTRLSEVQDLVDHPSALGPMSPHVPDAGASVPQASTSTLLSTLQDMDSETRAGATDLWSVFRSSGSLEPLHVLDRFTQKQYAELRALLPALPLPVQARAKSSLELLRLVATNTVAQATAGATGSDGQPSTGGQPGGPNAPTPSLTPGPGGTGTPGSTPTAPGATPPSGTDVLPTTAPTASGNVIPPSVPTIPSSPLPSPSVSTSPLPTDIPLPSLSTSSLLPSVSTSSLLPSVSTSSLLPSVSTSSLLPGIG